MSTVTKKKKIKKKPMDVQKSNADITQFEMR